MLKSTIQPTNEISTAGAWITQARAEIKPFTTPRPAIYWWDYCLSILIGYSASMAYLLLPFGSWWSVVLMFVGAFGTYRAAMFLHEIVHFRAGEMTAFKWFWNLTGGVIMLMPSFLYESHLSHHSSKHYGTADDGEYLPLGRGKIGGVIGFLAQSLFLPIFVYLRFLIGTPLSFLNPRIRQWVVEHASSFVIDFKYRRRIPEQLSLASWVFLEWACWLRATLPIVFISLGVMPWTRFSKLYWLAVLAIFINHLRTLAAHRYRSDGEPMGHHDQFMDSTNIKGGWLTELVCPVGLRYHALHHLFPAIPYHALGAAHARLMTALPPTTSYQASEYPSVNSVIRELVGSVTAARRGESSELTGH